MQRFYFDVRAGDALSVDKQGMELQDIDAVQKEAVRSLADIARDVIRRDAGHSSGHCMAVEVRDATGPVLQVKFSIEIERPKH